VGEAGSKVLAGKRVLVTRAELQSCELVHALNEAGAEAVAVPLVEFVPPRDFTGLDRCLTGATGKFDWVFFTSQNAVWALKERSEAIGVDLGESFTGAGIATVGRATWNEARAAGLPVHYVSTGHNGVALADELAKKVSGKRVFLPRSDRANPDLISALVRHGARVMPVVAYRTMMPEGVARKIAEIVAKKNVDAVLFFSPSVAHHLREIVGAESFREFGREAAFVAIGPVTERALKDEGVERVLTASDTTGAAAVAVLREFFGKAGQS
jgi:uroporphyrinogen-III synthase